MFKCFFPDEYVDSTYVIDFDNLYAQGYRGLLFDIDNTLVPHVHNSLVNKKHPQGITLWMFLWTWRELNPRPKAYSLRHLPSQSLF